MPEATGGTGRATGKLQEDGSCYYDIHHKKQRSDRALTINPAKTCQPIGAMYAALGIHNCLPHSHGSQGCCAYHRSALTSHYKDPIMATTSSFTEGASVFGGQANLMEAINNIFTHLRSGGDRRPYDVSFRGHRGRPGSDHQQGAGRGENTQGQEGHPYKYAQLQGVPCHRFREHDTEHGPVPGGEHRREDWSDQYHPGFRRAFGHGGDQEDRRRDGDKVHHVSRHLRRGQRPPGRKIPHVSQGRRNGEPDRRARATARSPSPSAGQRRFRQQSCSTRGARCPSRSSTFP